MNITLEIKPEVQAELARQASQSGLAFEAHAAHLLEAAAHLPTRNSPQLHNSTFGKALVDGFAEAQSILAGVDLDLTRDGSAGRPVDLS